jgi:hypothetical protein
VLAWGQTVSWNIATLSPYQWFPLFGIFAWMTMWTHYVIGAIRVNVAELSKPKYYSAVTGWLVLASLLLHPGILAYQQFRNDQGLPPESFINYVGESFQLAVMLGSIALLIFLSFEIFDRLKNNKIVQKYSLAISISQSVAMLFIFVHGLRLGTSLGEGWFRVVWVLMGIILMYCFYLIHRSEIAHITKESTSNN